MADYAVEIDVDNLNTSHGLIIDLVGSGRRVLDVGCWTGDTGRVLQARGCTVSGVEIDAEAAEVARADLEQVVVADLDASALTELFPGGSFDVVVLGDVLEHLADPVRVLADAASLLAPGGRVVISVPNVSHGSLRLALLQGHWRYTPTGLLDRTHIKFFDRAGVVELVADAGLVLDRFRGTVADPLSVEVAVDPHRLPPAVVEWVRDQPDALVYQFVLSARVPGAGESPADPADPAHPVPELDLPASPHDVRWRDAHTDTRRRDVDDRRTLLTYRDHVIGLEASVVSADARTRRVRLRLAAAQERAQRLRKRLDRSKKQNDRLQEAVVRLRERAERAEGVRLRSHVKRAVRQRLGR